MKRRITISAAPVNCSDFTEFHAVFNLQEDALLEIINDFAAICFGEAPYVFGTFPPDVKRETVTSKMRYLWDKYRTKPEKLL